MNSKIVSYLHFAFRSRKAVLGLNKLFEMKKTKISCIILNQNLAQNSRDKIKNKFGDLIIFESEKMKELFRDLNLSDYKVLTLLKSSLSRKIIEELKAKEKLSE